LVVADVPLDPRAGIKLEARTTVAVPAGATVPRAGELKLGARLGVATVGVLELGMPESSKGLAPEAPVGVPSSRLSKLFRNISGMEESLALLAVAFAFAGALVSAEATSPAKLGRPAKARPNVSENDPSPLDAPPTTLVGAEVGMTADWTGAVSIKSLAAYQGA
jgi:hypothetical protein